MGRVVSRRPLPSVPVGSLLEVHNSNESTNGRANEHRERCWTVDRDAEVIQFEVSTQGSAPEQEACFSFRSKNHRLGVLLLCIGFSFGPINQGP